MKISESTLALLDALPLECDGMCRVISTILERDKVPHTVYMGSLAIKHVGGIPLHFWIAFDDGHILDLRARMWLGHTDKVPHGYFVPAPEYWYRGEQIETSHLYRCRIVTMLTGRKLETFPPLFTD